MKAVHRLPHPGEIWILCRAIMPAWWMARLGRRGRAWQAAISPGEAQAAVDPGIPEWDFLPHLGRSRQGAGTRGKETSEYPQEKKPTGMPGVGATETGTGQTESLPVKGREMWGCRAPNTDPHWEAEVPWNGAP